jgi:hypothetical protein
VGCENNMTSPSVWNLSRVSAFISQLISLSKRIRARKDPIDSVPPKEGALALLDWIEVTGVTERLRQNLLLASVDEAFLMFLLHASLGDRTSADRLLADWHVKFTEFESVEKKLSQARPSIQIVGPAFEKYLESCVRIYVALRDAYSQCSLAIENEKLPAAFSALCNFQRLQAQQAEIAAKWLKYFPEETGPDTPVAA